jgi:predicted dehydrogenase
VNGREHARVAVVGCGWWGTRAHLAALAQNDSAEIVAVVDPEQSRRDGASAAFDVPHAFADAETMLDAVEVDGVVIAAPARAHYQLARTALARGLHVLVEKPMVVDPAHGRELIALARARGVELIVGYPMLYSSQGRAVKAALQGGCIGEIEYVTCLFASIAREFYRGNTEAYREPFGYPLVGPRPDTYSDATDGGQARTQITHSASLLFWLTGLRPHSVAAMTEEFELGVDLADAVAVRFEGGAIGTVSSTGSVTARHEELLHIELFGHDGHLIFDVNQGRASIHAATTTEFPSLPVAERYPENGPADNLVEVILGRGPNGSPAENALLTAEFIAAIHRSAAERRFVRCDTTEAAHQSLAQ